MMIITFDQLPEIRRRYLHEKIVLVGGCYDLLHAGHVAYLERCKKSDEILIVAVSSDKRVAERKGSERPIIPQENRAGILSKLEFVNYALVAPDPEEEAEPPTIRLLKKLRPNVFATADERYDAYQDSLWERGIEVRFVEPVQITSTTHIINVILKRYCHAN